MNEPFMREALLNAFEAIKIRIAANLNNPTPPPDLSTPEKCEANGYERKSFGSVELLWKPFEVSKGMGPNGFEFTSFALEGESFNPPEKVYSPFIHGRAFFDGIRHLYFGPEEADENNDPGYFCYPNLSDFLNVLGFLKDLEEKYCPSK